MKGGTTALVLVFAGLGAIGFNILPAQESTSLSNEALQSPAISPQTAKTEPRSSLVIVYDQIPTTTAQRRVLEVGATQYLIVYQGVDPQAKSGLINPQSVIKEVESRSLKSLPRYGVLDFESPYAEILQKGSGDPRWAQTISTMVALIQSVRTRFPTTRWTFYGVPFVPYWIAGTDWESATPEQRKEALNKIFEANAPLVKEMDWVNCSIYPVYEPELFNPKDPSRVRSQGRAWRRAAVSLSCILANGKPVMPMISPYWQPNGVARAGCPVPRDEFIEDQVAVAVEAGATGVAVWTGIGTFIDLAIKGDPEASNRDDGFSAGGWRATFTKEFFSGIEPSVWVDPSVRTVLESRTSSQVADAIRWIREWETEGRLPQPDVKQ